MSTSFETSTLVFVRDVDAAITFYVGKLGFTLNMRHEEGSAALVAGVSRDHCSLLLTCQWPEKTGLGVLYAAFDEDEHSALCTELIARGVSFTEGWWGNDLLIVTDDDGNQLWIAKP